MLGLRTRNYSCCRTGCMTFTDENRMRRRYLHYKEFQFIEPDDVFDEDLIFYLNLQSYVNFKPRAMFIYMSIISHLKLLYANETYSAKMRYPTILLTENVTLDHNEEMEIDDEKWERIRDIWEGEVMKRLRTEGIRMISLLSDRLTYAGYFDDEWIVALHFSTDDVWLFRNSRKEAWPFLLLNLNLDPRERYN